MTAKNEISNRELTQAIEEFENLCGYLAKFGLAEAIPRAVGQLYAGSVGSEADGKLFPLEGAAGYSFSLGIMRAPGHADAHLIDVLCELTHTAVATKDKRPAFTFAKRTGAHYWRAVLTDVDPRTPSALLSLAESVDMVPHTGSVELDNERLLIGLRRSVAIFATGD